MTFYISFAGEYLSTMIEQILQRYDIRIDQIYSITTDNGSNYVKARKIIQSKSRQLATSQSQEEAIVAKASGSKTHQPILLIDSCESSCNDNSDRNDTADHSDNETNENEISENANGNSNENENSSFLCGKRLREIGHILAGTKNVSSGSTNIGVSELRNIENFADILQLLYCAAHTLQICINKALKIFLTDNFIEKIRDTVKALRSPNLARLLKKQNLRRPQLNTHTRWNSICTMVRNIFTNELIRVIRFNMISCFILCYITLIYDCFY